MNQLIKTGGEKSLITILVFIIAFFSISAAQSIRKNFTELSQSEKDELVNAYSILGGIDGTSGKIDELATFHDVNFDDIHNNNNPTNSLTDVFHPWHRMASFELEQAMQSIDPSITLPYWDWTVENSPTGSLWASNFLGQFNTAWSLGRDLGSGSLPAGGLNGDVEPVQAITTYQDYRETLEFNVIHIGAHNWVALPSNQGGIMASGNSPKDPVFYFHHNTVDKLWQEWQETHGGSSFQLTSMPKYPNTNPNDIIDSRSLGVFYSENELATLDKYTVNNTTKTPEFFGYQFTIEAENDFEVPNNKSCEFASCNEVVLKKGFHARSGSDFLARIDQDCDFTSPQKRQPEMANDRSGAGYVSLVSYENAYSRSLDLEFNVNTSPNPFQDQITFTYEISDSRVINLQIFNTMGKLIAIPISGITQTTGRHDFHFDGSNLPDGVYFYTLKAGTASKSGKIVLQR